MQKSSILIILIAYIIGIIISGSINFYWLHLFVIWVSAIFSLLLIIFLGRQKIFFKKWISWDIIIIFFISGMLGYSLKDDSTSEKKYFKHYLEGDKLIGEIIEFQEGNGTYNKAIISIEKVLKHKREIDVNGKLLCYIKSGEKKWEAGTIVLLQPKIIPITNKNNPGEFDAKNYWRGKGISKMSFFPEETIEEIGKKSTFSGFWVRTRNYLISIIKEHISEENQGLVIALSLGDKSNLSIERRNEFANAGAMHVLAVSGMHVGILLAFVQFIFKQFKFLRKRNLYLYFALVFLWCFALITGLPASVARAVTTFSILAIGQLMGKRFFSLQGIFASALLLLIFDPMLLYDIGFQLSYLAVITIGLFYIPILNLYRPRHKIVKWLWSGTAIGFAAQIGTVPLSLMYFNQFPNYFILSNIGLLIISAIALNSVVVFLLLHFVPYINDVLIFVVNFIFDVFVGFISWINTLPAVVSIGFTPHLPLLFVIYFSILFTLYQWNKKNLKLTNLGTVLLFLSTLLLIVNRESNKMKEELVVLNHYNKTILIKRNRELLLISDEQRKPSEKELDFLIRGYENKTGVIAKRMTIPINSQFLISEDIVLQNEKQGLKIDYFTHKLILANTISPKLSNSDYKIVKGDWNPYLPEDNIDINTQEGALTLRPVTFTKNNN